MQKLKMCIFLSIQYSLCAGPLTDLEWKILRAKEAPGAGAYELRPKSVSGGQFNMSNPKSDIEWKIHTAKQMPGPGQ